MATKTQPTGGTIYVVIDGFVTDLAGIPTNFNAGDTVREGHPILESHRHLFKVLVPVHEWAAHGEWEERA